MSLIKDKTEINYDLKSTRTCIVGQPKIGKSTFVSKLGQSVLVIDLEDGYRMMKNIKIAAVKNYADFQHVIKDVETNNAKYNFTTVAIDPVDTLLRYAEFEICARNKVTYLKDMAYGSGYQAMRRMIEEDFMRLRNLGLGLVFSTHESLREYKSENLTTTATCTSLNEKYEEYILGMCDYVFHAWKNNNDEHMIRTKPNKRVKCAGDRSGKLPEVMPLNAELVLRTLAGEDWQKAWQEIKARQSIVAQQNSTVVPVVSKVESKTTTKPNLTTVQ